MSEATCEHMPALTNATQYLNALRVLAITGVIMGHVFMTTYSYFAPVLADNTVYFILVLRNIWYWCIPIFVMISGVLFLDPDKKISIGKLFEKYILRLVLALLIFGVPYAFAEQLVAFHYHFSIRQIGTAFLMVIQGTTDNHLWYLYFIIGLYLVIPMIKVFTDNVDRKMLEYTLIMLFVFTSILPFIKNVLHFNIGFYIPVNSVYVFYFLIGHYIHKYNIKINVKLLMAVIILYLIYAALMPLNNNLVLSRYSGRLLSLEQDSPVVALISLALFCLLHQSNKANRFIDFLSPLCFGIYLIHPLFLFSLYLFLHVTPEKSPLIIFLLVTIICTAIPSVGFAYFEKKIEKRIRIWYNRKKERKYYLNAV
jgi:surface polysaccharide O-acyltransferase-like enzyme